MCHHTPVAKKATKAARTTLIRGNFDRIERSFGGLEGTEKNGFGPLFTGAKHQLYQRQYPSEYHLI
jgi:hypothetical protein